MKVISKVREADDPIDEHLFEQVGKELGMSGGTAKNMYYDKRNQSEFDGIIKMAVELGYEFPLLKKRPKI